MKPSLKERLDWTLIKEEAAKFSFNPILIAAIIGAESDGDTYRNRIETQMRIRNNPQRFASIAKISVETEVANQGMSWGLMQVMGVTARDMGLEKSLLTLIEPDVGIEWGCHYLAHIFKLYQCDFPDAIAAYNAGSIARGPAGDYKNQGYVTKVLNLMKELK